MAEDLTLATFEPHVGTTFTVRVPVDDEVHEFEFELVEALDISDRMKLPEEFRDPFRLSFRGPPHLVLAQTTYEVEHPEAGRHDLFLVPVMVPAEDGRHLYEVIVA
jgi:hypothetical protein